MWRFRRTIPDDVRAAIAASGKPGPREWKLSLGKDEADARRRAHEETTRTDAVIKGARESQRATSHVSERELERVAQKVFAERLKGQMVHIQDRPDFDPENFQHALDETLDPWALGLRENAWTTTIDRCVTDYLTHHGLFLPVDTDDFAKARRQMRG